MKIVTGGQTGADRAALDWAIQNGIPHGGWCPKGRLSEDGTIDARYGLIETSTKRYVQRTEMNIRDSDGTVICTLGDQLSGGTGKTAELAARHRKPWIHLTPASQENALAEFVLRHGITVLNVAGSRASQEPGIYQFVQAILDRTLGLFASRAATTRTRGSING
jgi:predicted Rossmann-fold nucleotide-binding protein